MSIGAATEKDLPEHPTFCFSLSKLRFFAFIISLPNNCTCSDESIIARLESKPIFARHAGC